MSTFRQANIEFYEFLRTKFTAQELFDWQLSEKVQEDVHHLLDKNNAGTISEAEIHELKLNVDFNHCFTFIKIQALIELKDES